MNSNRKWLATLVLIAVLSLVGLGLFTIHYDALGSETAIGVFGSLLATGVLSLCASVLQGRSDPPEPALQVATPPVLTPQVSIPGLIRVLPKTDVTPDEWWRLMGKAEHEFFLAGHSLGKWCGGTHGERFGEDIVRILRKHGRVTLLTLGPGSPQLERLKQATGRDYTKAVEESRDFLHKLLTKLDANQKARLVISVLPEHAALPYTVVGNEHTLLTATYLSSRDRDEVPCLEMARKSDAAISIYDDFCLLVKQGNEFGNA
jgi:hypothetical protein